MHRNARKMRIRLVSYALAAMLVLGGFLWRSEREKAVCDRYGQDIGEKALKLYRAAYPGKNELYLNDLDVMARAASAEYVRAKAAAQAAPRRSSRRRSSSPPRPSGSTSPA